MTDRAIGGDVTRGCAHAQLEVVVSRSFFVFLDILCSTQYPFSSFFFFFFHNTCLTSKKTNFFTRSVASTGFSKNLVTSFMLCPAHRCMSL